MRNTAAALIAATAALTLAACSTADAATTLKKDDPAGYAACDIYMNAPGDWAKGASDVEMSMGVSLVAYDHAKDATTPEIAATVSKEQEALGIGMVDGDDLISACQDLGMEIHPDSMAQKRADHASS